MNAPMKLHCVSIALCVLSGAAALRVVQQGTAVIELRDDSGKVRMRLGRMGTDDSRFGVEVLDDKGVTKIAIENSASESKIDVSGAGDRGRLSVRVKEAGTGVTLGPAEGWHLFLGQVAEGVFNVRYANGQGPESDARMSLTCDPREKGRSHFRLFNGKDSAIVLNSDRKGSIIEMLRDKVSDAKVIAENGVGSYFLLGTRTMGAFMEALKDGTAVLELTRDKSLVTLQSTERGLGFTVDRAEGKPAIRLGVNPAGEVKDQQWDEKGNLLSPAGGDAKK